MPKRELTVDQNTLIVATDNGQCEIDIYSEEGFEVLAKLWLKAAWERRISYQVTWLGIPIIQLPEDILMMQELIHKVRPDIIVETGIAHGGSAIFYASILELLGKGQVISIDKEIRTYNRLAIQSHPMSKRITLIEGSSTDERVLTQVRSFIQPGATVLVVLDSNHTYAHVREEMEKYASLVTRGSYLVVFDGVMEILADVPHGSPTWSSDNPAAAIRDFLAGHPEFEVDPYYNRLAVSYCPAGFLKHRIG
jgi:cephalosporin hydroxylase